MTVRRWWPLVGRADELTRIEAARVAGAPGVVVSASAGVGKSRVAREALAAGERARCAVGWVQATRSAASVPLGAFASLLGLDVRSDDVFELMARCVAALKAGAAGRPLVLGVDDAQWLDPTSAALVLQVATTGTAFVVVTLRTGEPRPDAISSLWKDAGAERLLLERLDPLDVERLVEAVVGGPVELGARRWMASVGHGNALYARELVAAALVQGRLTEVDGLWRMPVRPEVSPSLGELVRSGMNDLDEEQQQALALLAIGEPLLLEQLIRMTSVGLLETLEERGLIAVGGVPRAVRLAHPLYGDVIRAGVGSLRAREVRLALAASLRDRKDLGPEDVLRLVRWLLDAGEPVSPPLALAGARAANLAADPDLGAALAENARPGECVPAGLVLAQSHVMRSRYHEAAAVLADIEHHLGTQEHALEFLERQSEILHWGLKRPADLHALLDRAGRWWPDPEWTRRIEALRVRVASFERLGDGLATSEDLMAADHNDPSGLDDVRPVHVANLFYAGHTSRARLLAEQIRPTPPLRSLSDAITVSLWARILLETGEDWSGLHTWMTTALEDGVNLSDPATAGQAAYWLAGLRFAAGYYLDAGRLLAQARVHLERHDPVGLLPTATALEVEVACFTDDQQRVSSALERMRNELANGPPLAHQAPYVVRAEAWALHAAGDLVQAQQLLVHAADSMNSSPLHRARLTYEALRAGAPAPQVATTLHAMREKCDARLVSLYADHAAAQQTDNGAALLEVADKMEEIGARRYAAEASARAADAFARAGRQDSARRAASKLQSLLPTGQGGTPPAITELDQSAVALTTRETQLVKLASHGKTNAQIAEQLVVSVRTVESHLYRAMQKLGVNDRREL